MNKNLNNVAESINVKLANKIREIEIKGTSIVKMQTGDPDFSTPSFICIAAQQAMEQGDTHYCASNGQAKLRKAIKNKLINKNKILAATESNILVTQGAVHGLYLTLQTLLNQGDEVIIISPYWMPYHSNIILAGGVPIVVESKFLQGFIPDLSTLTAAITKKTKAIIINSPNNPTGCVYKKSILKDIANICDHNKIYLISDEVYEDLLYQSEHHSAQALLPESKYIISLFSFSKSYAMTGWRIGYIYTSLSVIEQANKLTQYITTSINSFVQAGAIAALEHQDAPLAIGEMHNVFSERREMIKTLISGTWLENNIFFPQGAFYVFIDISSFKVDSMTFVEQLIEHHQIAFTPGIAFGEQSDHFIRMTFASNDQAINIAVNTLIGLR